MKDYYAILGLDPDASLDTIKRAFRLRAREAHPDRFSHMGEQAQAEATTMMADLNEAYAVLSDPERRREYDLEWRAFQAGEALPETPAPAAPQPVPDVAPVAVRRERARPATDMGASMIREFATRIRQDLLVDRKTFPWQERKFEGFDWALEAGFFMDHYYVASRAFGTADPLAAQKFINYVDLAVQQVRHWFKNDFFLFLLPFQKLSEPERVQAVLRRYQPSGRGPRVLSALLDVTHGRSVLAGTRSQDEKFHQLLRSLRLKR